MKVEEKGHTIIIKDTQNNLVAFLMKLTHEYKTFQSRNMIIDISNERGLMVKDILTFLPLFKLHKKAKKSFIIVASDFDFNANTKDIVVVRSILEAHDIIEMEEIERDLGF
jgi:hypothetical protein